MSNRFRLVSMKNDELVAGLSQLAERNNELTGDLLAHLAELEDRMLHLKLGFPSSFAYCVEALGLSEGAAGRRVAAARVCRRFPDAFQLVARGDLHLSALCALSRHLNPENASELFTACRRKTRRQVEELLAVRFPKPDVRDQIRRLPGRPQVPEREHTQSEASAQPSDTPLLQDAAAAKSSEIQGDRDIETARPAEAGAATPLRRRELEALSVDRFGIHFTADAELRELIERARALASHRLPKNDLSSLMRLVLTSFVQNEEARRFAVGRKARQEKAATPPGEVTAAAGSHERKPTRNAARSSRVSKRSRHVPAAVRRTVYLRDQGRCSFVSEDGRRCPATAFLELDHIEPWAVLGDAVVDNIRLRCRAHNQLHARNCFGIGHVAAKIAARSVRMADSAEETGETRQGRLRS
jgi:hypothetical protein